MDEATKKKFAQLLYQNGYHDLTETLCFNPEDVENFEEVLYKTLVDIFADMGQRTHHLYREKQLLSKGVQEVVGVLSKLTDDIREMYKK